MNSKHTFHIKQFALTAALSMAVLALSACQPLSNTGAGADSAPAAAAEQAGQATEQATDEATEEATGQASAAADSATVQVNVTAGGIEMPSEIPSGIVTFVYQLAEDAPGLPEFARLNEGVTVDQLMEAMQQDMMAALPLVTMLGNSDKSVGGEMTYELQPGEYVGLLFPEEGAPITTTFTAGEASGAAEPQSALTAQLADFAFIMPDEVAAGPQTWLIENTGGQWHELGILKLEEGTNVNDLLAMLAEEEQAGPPPFEDVAFLSPIGAGQRTWVTWDLPPGEYTVICFLPDLAGDMAPHAAHGMVRTLVVK
jgi:hypothetical protein